MSLEGLANSHISKSNAGVFAGYTAADANQEIESNVGKENFI